MAKQVAYGEASVRDSEGLLVSRATGTFLLHRPDDRPRPPIGPPRWQPVPLPGPSCASGSPSDGCIRRMFVEAALARRRARLRIVLVPRTSGPAGGMAGSPYAGADHPPVPPRHRSSTSSPTSGLPGRSDEPDPPGHPRLQPGAASSLHLGPGHPDRRRGLRRPPRGRDRGRVARSRMDRRRARLRQPGGPARRGPRRLPAGCGPRDRSNITGASSTSAPSCSNRSRSSHRTHR